MNFLDTILNIVLPTDCISCGKRGQDLCLECLSGFPITERESASWIFPFFDYRHIPIKKSIWLLKYKGKKRLAYIFATVMYEKIIEELSDLKILNNFNNPILIPIPLSKKRFRERGYNQSELICQELVKIDNVRNNVNWKLEKNILIKIKETEHQTNIHDRKNRLENLSNSFSIKNEEAIKNKNIILLDDVLTTGATLNEAKKILKRYGARKVIAFTIAH